MGWRDEQRQVRRLYIDGLVEQALGTSACTIYKERVLNYIWLGLVVLAVAIGGWNNRFAEVTAGALDGAKTAVVIALGLIGIMALWLGVMRLAERAGFSRTFPRIIQPWDRC
jgi:hypothetical protein